MAMAEGPGASKSRHQAFMFEEGTGAEFGMVRVNPISSSHDGAFGLDSDNGKAASLFQTFQLKWILGDKISAVHLEYTNNGNGVSLDWGNLDSALSQADTNNSS